MEKEIKTIAVKKETGIKEIQCYRTTDMRIWENKERAEEIQIEIDNTEWYETGENCLLSSSGDRVIFSDLLEWLKTHNKKVLSLIMFTATLEVGNGDTKECPGCEHDLYSHNNYCQNCGIKILWK